MVLLLRSSLPCFCTFSGPTVLEIKFCRNFFPNFLFPFGGFETNFQIELVSKQSFLLTFEHAITLQASTSYIAIRNGTVCSAGLNASQIHRVIREIRGVVK